MNILTDEEIDKLVQNHRGNNYDQLARAIESAVLSKLAEQDMEPVAWQDTQTGMIYTTVSPAAKHLYSPIYTETQLITAKQRTAEACAKAVERLIGGDGLCAYDGVWIHDCAEAIRNGHWREYL